jgi:hypothetical protein
MIRIPNVSQAQLQTLLDDLQSTGQATINPTGPTSGTIQADHKIGIFVVHIKAAYSIVSDGSLTISSNHGEDDIRKEILSVLGRSA